jgi:hypothetical protein
MMLAQEAPTAAGELTLIRCATGATERAAPAAIEQLVIAGWTGRNAEAVEKHIAELEAIGVPRPKRTPIFYRVGASLLTTAVEIQVIGGDSSGEAEFVVFNIADETWVGVGSDHTDRKAETVGVTLSKQLCPKPIGQALWRYEDVAAHWEQLMLRSWVGEGPRRRLYQEGPVSAMRHPEELMQMYTGGPKRLSAGCAMFCGTHAVMGNVEPAAVFEVELEDPVLGRRIGHRYRITQLPIEG